MSMILKRGRLPRTPHTEFYAKEGVLALEEVHGSLGFMGRWARKLHVRRYPTQIVKPPEAGGFDLSPNPAPEEPLQPYLVQTGDMPFGEDPHRCRTPIVFGPNTEMSIAKPDRSTPEGEFFRNGEKHEAYFVQEGEGILETEYGRIAFVKGRYLLIPKGTTYRIELKSERAWFLIVESSLPIHFPNGYLNKGGQATPMSPIVESEIEEPEFVEPRDEKGEFPVRVKHGGGRVTKLTLDHHPFDLAGWAGALYPFGFDIDNHHGIAREIHVAPPMHMSFEAGRPPFSGFSLCSFVPQMEGWHPKEVPVPYAHYNVDSDEMMFFSNSDYGARKGVVRDGAFTVHPSGVPHSPHGRAALDSLSQRGKKNKRLAVMLDTCFETMRLSGQGWQFRDKEYAVSWHKAAEGTLHGT